MAAINVTVVGCGDAFGSGGRLHTCFYLQTDLVNVLVDCGATAYGGLKRYGINVSDIDVIIISHFHGDHYGGIPFILLDAAIHGREKPLTMISPPTGEDRIARLLDQLYPGTNVLNKLAVRFEVYRSGAAVKGPGGMDVWALPVLHSPAAMPHGVRIGLGGKVIGYSGDTEWTPALIDLARDADLFLCECNFFESEVAGHMTYKVLQAVDDQLTYKRMVLTHLGPEMLENQHQLTHACADDGLEILL